MAIVTHERFGGAEVLSRLKEQGIEISAKVDDVKLSAPAYGETIVGEATSEERLIFARMFALREEYVNAGRKFTADAFTAIGEKLRSANMDTAEKWMESVLPPADNDTHRALCRLDQQIKFLSIQLYWMIGERLNLHHWHLGIRSQWRIVKINARTPQPPA